MTKFRTIEEKFLADFERLEKENESLRETVAELEGKLRDERKNITLDALVRAEGRRKVFSEAVRSWGKPDVGDRDFDTWVRVFTYEHNIPQGVSMQEFIDYFEVEYQTEFEEKIAEEIGSE